MHKKKKDLWNLPRSTAIFVAVPILTLATAAYAQNPDRQGTPPASPPVGAGPSGPTDQAPPAADVGELFDDRGVLTPRHALIFEPSLELSYSSANRVAIEAFTIIPAVAVGLIDVREVRRETYTAAATFRYGLTNRLEIEARIPYVNRRDEVRQRQLLEPSSDDVIINSNGDGLGDVEAALHYQFNIPHDGGPYYIGNLRAKSRTGTDIFEAKRELVMQNDLVVGERLKEQPTGSGFWGVEPSLTVVYPTDPAVFFGNLGYTWNLERDMGGDVGKIDPGDFLNLSFGMGFGINKRTSFSLGYDHTVVFETKQEGVDNNAEFDRIHVGSLLIGFSHQVAKKTTLNLSLGIGVTEDAPDVQLTLRAPLRVF